MEDLDNFLFFRDRGQISDDIVPQTLLDKLVVTIVLDEQKWVTKLYHKRVDIIRNIMNQTYIQLAVTLGKVASTDTIKLISAYVRKDLELRLLLMGHDGRKMMVWEHYANLMPGKPSRKIDTYICRESALVLEGRKFTDKIEKRVKFWKSISSIELSFQ